ncbi:hypothetical protein ZIOFF_017527 [Zingiber officinale]|uniref:NAC domain-containing protein n=1 Tax=Zingiber officinale TaxID=94328 RepID=A0A8J5LIB8_ZINOF|nr:hypothetical protein ZIOFF_017527 [Zingiber officinale]
MFTNNVRLVQVTAGTISSFFRSWLITCRGIAKKVKNGGYFLDNQGNDLAVVANRECPNCHHLIDNSDVTLDWPGLPAGVKFDPSDVELLEHLAGKVGAGNKKPHILIDEFIPMLEEKEGICYTHPENLPGVKQDGSSIHFFHRISNAYGSGQRKHRKINQCSLTEERIRWHKTGKTKRVLENGVLKGWKKIMVLYKSSLGSCKPDRVNWVMHQYHLGPEEDEKEGELVVSKVFYQQSTNQLDKSDMELLTEEGNVFTVKGGPKTPKTNTPQPPRLKNDSPHENSGQNLPSLLVQENPINVVPDSPLHLSQLEGKVGTSAWWADESQAADLSNVHESLLCHEIFDPFPHFEDSSLYFNCTNMDSSKNETVAGTSGIACGIADLDSIIMDTPPDFQLSELQFGSQESIMSWLDRF